MLTFYMLLFGIGVSGLMRFHNGSDKGIATDFVQISEKVLRRPWQWLDKNSGKTAGVVHGKSRLTETEKGETDEEHTYNLLWHQGDCSLRIHPGRPNSQFSILCDFYGDCMNLATKELAVWLFVCTQQHSSSSKQHTHTNPLNTLGSDPVRGSPNQTVMFFLTALLNKP
jgi:hypothetical protein